MESAVEIPAARARLDVGGLLPVAVPLALVVFALVTVAPGLVTQDAWLTLVGGREIAEHGLPHVAHLTQMAQGHHFVDQQWLAQLVLYGTGGISAAVAVCLAAAAAAFCACAVVAHRRGSSPAALLVFAVWALAAAPWGFQVRAQSLALPLFALILLVLELDRPYLTLPVLAVWANVHGSVVIGVAVVVAYAVCRRRPLLLCAPAAILVSPYAADLPRYYRTMLVEPPFGRAIKEWHRTAPSALTAAFFLLLVATAILVIRRRSSLGAFEVAVLALTAAVALDAIRGIVWFALAALALVPAVATRNRERRPLRDARLATLAFGVVAGALCFAAARPASAYEHVPAGVLAHVVGPGPVFANEASADWLLWREPSVRVAYDVQFEMLTPRQIDLLLGWRRFAPGWREVVRGYPVVVDDPQHVSRLVAGGGWRRVFTSPRIAVARRIAP